VNSYLIQFIKKTLILTCLVFWAAPSYAVRLRAAIMLDFGDVLATSGALKNEDLGFDNNFEVRRARIVAKDKFSGWLYKVRLNLVNLADNDDSDNAARVDRAYIGYAGWKVLEIRFGLQPEPFGLEKSTSSKYVTFLERSLLDTFSPEDNLGLYSIFHIADPLSIHLGTYVGRPYPKGSKTSKSVTGRIVYDLIKQDRKLVHLGASYRYQKPLDNRVRYKERPEAHLSDKLFKSNRLKNVDWVRLTGIEAAFLRGPVSLQMEYLRSNVVQIEGLGEKVHVLDGYYVYLSWFLTGESRHYSNNNFGRIRPKNSIGKGGWGAWEIALRYSNIEDDEKQRLTDITYGLNWYLTKKTRFMLNLVEVEYTSDDEKGKARIGQMRFQQLF